MRIILLKNQSYVLVKRVKVLLSLEKLKMTAIYLEKLSKISHSDWIRRSLPSVISVFSREKIEIINL